MYSYRKSDTVYFRISSQGFDWTNIIKNFCEDTFGVKSLQLIWVGLDEDNRGSARRYFEGTVKDLLFKNLNHEVLATGEYQRKFY